jgi:hypothetical protein
MTELHKLQTDANRDWRNIEGEYQVGRFARALSCPAEAQLNLIAAHMKKPTAPKRGGP